MANLFLFCAANVGAELLKVNSANRTVLQTLLDNIRTPTSQNCPWWGARPLRFRFEQIKWHMSLVDTLNFPKHINLVLRYLVLSVSSCSTTSFLHSRITNAVGPHIDYGPARSLSNSVSQIKSVPVRRTRSNARSCCRSRWCVNIITYEGGHVRSRRTPYP